MMLGLALSLSQVAAAQTTITVNTNTQGPVSGSCSLHDAILIADGGAPSTGSTCTTGTGPYTITLAAATTYYLSATDSSSSHTAGTPDINPGASGSVTIQGAGAGSTIIQDTNTSAMAIFSVTGGTVTFTGLTVTGGQPGLLVPSYGVSATLNINNCTFSNNSYPNSRGGAIAIPYYSNAVNLNITNSLFSGNSATYDGGAIYIYNYYGGTISITHSSFTNNTSTNGGYSGGAISISSATSASLQYCSFSGNSATYGAAVLSNIPLTISNSSFTNNSASNQGGGLYLSGSGAQTTITASTFSGNTAGDAGGGIYRYYNGSVGQVLSLVNTTLSANTATNGGGGIYLYGGGLTNSNGGGLDLNNVTISGNIAHNSNNYAGGGGLAFQNVNPNDFFTFENTIIAGNTDTSNTSTTSPDCSTVQMGSATLASQGYNLIGNDTNCSFIPTTGDQVGTSSVPINPLLGPLQNNGAIVSSSLVTTFVCGPAGLTCPEPSTLALLLGSPAIDAANPATPSSGPAACATTDEDGVSRPQGTACDIGAFETDITVSPLSLSFPPTTNPNTSPSQTVTFTNYANPSLTINSITTTGDFTQTNTCGKLPASLAAGSCTINVVFAPASGVTGTLSGTLTIQTTDGSSPVTVNLTGQANPTSGVPFAQLTPPVSLPFGSEPVGSPTSPLTVTLANPGTAALTISNIATTGDFAVASTGTTCGASLAAGLSCTISLTFKPMIIGAEMGSLVVTDNSNNVANSTQSLVLTGTGIGMGLSATSLIFPDTGVFNTSGPQTLILTNTTSNNLTINTPSFTGDTADFSVSANTCSAAVPPLGTCTISVTFTPQATGVRAATLTISSTGAPTVTVALSGSGVQSQVIGVNTTAQFAADLTNDCTLGDAIKAAQTQLVVHGCAAGSSSGNTIIVPAGTYHLERINNLNRAAASPDISTTLTIQGAGPGITIIQRDSGAPGFAIFSVTGGTVTFTGLTVTGGQPGLLVPSYGVSATLNINNCTFSNNSYPNSRGGAIAIPYYSNTVNLTITNSLFSGNSATYDGGAIYVYNNSAGTISISHSSFTNNTSTNGGYSGGAISISSATSASLQYCSFSGNSATYGAAVLSNIPLTISNSSFTNNSASNQGGGLYLSGSGAQTTITASTFSGNTAGDTGGGIYRYYNGSVGQVLRLVNTTLSGNTATNGGGGIYLYGGGLTSSNGGGLDLNNVTISGNIAHNSNNYAGGGGLAFQNVNPNDFFTFENTIIAGNTDTSNLAPDCSTVQMGGATLASQGYNLVGTNTNCSFIPRAGDQVGNNTVPTNPLLGPLQNNGAIVSGSLVTTFVCGPAGLPCPEPSTLALLLGSPAIDAGNPATPSSGPAACATTDELGQSRPRGAACDIGAFETDINVSPLSLSFPPTNMGSPSAAQTITFTNYANPSLTISGVSSSSSDFPPTGCTGTLAAGHSCTISVVFSPQTATPATSSGTLTITSSDGSSPVSVNLTGQANVTTPFAQLTPPVSLPFGSVTVGTSSALPVTLTNTGNATLTISNIATTGDFAVASTGTTCPALPFTLTSTLSCVISVTFKPTIVGAEVGSLVVTDNAPNSPQTLVLTGTGVGVGLSATTLTFPDTPFTTPTGTTSAPETLTFTNTTDSPATLVPSLTSGNTGDFAVSATTCSPVAAGTNCTISVTFTPQATGLRTAMLTITGGPVTLTVALIGGGIEAQVITVNTTAQFAVDLTNDCTLGDAIKAAQTQLAVKGCAAGSSSGNTIIVPAGTYHLERINNLNRAAASPDISTTLTIQGAGPGITIIQRDSGAPGFAIFSVTGGTVTFTGLTVTGGQPGLLVPSYGVSATLNINNCTFSNNSYPNSRGGAIAIPYYSNTVNLNITNSLFSGNSATYDGGAIYIYNNSAGTISITHSSFTNNTSTNGGYSGGAISISSATSASLQYCSFSGNSATYGAAVLSNIPLTISNSSFTNNSASQGGGLYLQGGGISSSITASTFSGNTASDVGGGIYRYYNGSVGQVLRLVSTTLSGNTATNGGGGIYLYGAGLNSSYGGGLDLNNVTISGNIAHNSNNYAGGGGLAFQSMNPDDFFTFENTIIAGNTDTSNLAPDCSTVQMGSATFASQGYNLIGNDTNCSFIPTAGDQVGTSSVPINPLLGPLHNNGAIVSTSLVTTFVCGPAGLTCPEPSTLALLLGSPAIDAGNPATPSSGPAACATTDELGQSRPLGAACDIGAFEADINVSPLSLSFPPTSNPSTSAAPTAVTFTNYGNPSLTINSIATSGDFTQTNTCGTLPASLPATGGCTISVVFAPSVAVTGPSSGQLTIQTSDASNPVTVNLTGQANVSGVPFGQLTPPVSLPFSGVPVGTTSAAQTVMLANTGTTGSTLTISKIATTGDFAVSGTTCGTTLVAPATCTISVTYTPTIVGAEVGSLVVTDNSNNVANSTQSLILTGTGIGLGVSPTTLVFPDTGVPGGTNTQPLTLTNTTSSTVTLSFGIVGPNFGDFSENDNCASVAANATCTVSVTFTPTATGTRTATLTIAGGPSPQTVTLIGGGVASGVITVNTLAQIATSNLDCTLGDAIKAAQTQLPVNGCAAGSSSGNTIYVPAGTFDLTRINNPSYYAALPTINTTLTIQGAGATILQRDPAAPSFEIFYQSGGTLTLNGLTVTGGQPGVYVPCCSISATLNINASTFSNNSYPGGYGGAIYVSSSSTYNLTIANSLFSANTASYYGGAIYYYGGGGTLSVSNSSFTNNTSTANYSGGAIYINSSTSASIQSCNFSGNSGGTGGAVYDYNTPLTLSGSAFTNNSATSVGGALYLGYGNAINSTISASTFSGNTAGNAGGAIYRDYGTSGQVTSLTNVTISGNTATAWGGGIAVYAYYGGGLELNNVTISNNTAKSSPGGGGIAYYSLNSGDTYKFENTLIAGNTDTSNNGPDCSTVNIGSGSLASRGYNLIGNNTGCTFTAAAGDQVGTSSTPINPFLDVLALNSAPSYACGPNSLMCTGNQTQGLIAGSTAINGGNRVAPGSGSPACAATDERGVTRPQATYCDIGAFEGSVKGTADLALSLSASGTSVVVGSTVTYTLTVTSSGPDVAPGVTLTDTLPAGVTFASATPSTGLCSVAPAVVTCNLGNIVSGNSANVSIVVATTTPGTITNTATVSSTATDPTPTDNTATVNTTVVPTASANLSTASLTFGNELVGATSLPQDVVLTNPGTGPLVITSIVASGDFAEVDNCDGSLAAGASCTIGVTFTPTAIGPRTGALTLTDSAGNSPQTVTLTGTGLAGVPVVTQDKASLTFGSQIVGVTSAAQMVTLTNTGTASLAFTSFTFAGDFAQDAKTTTCSTSTPLALSKSCTVGMTFTPSAGGTRPGSLTIIDNAGNAPQVVTLSGTGIAPGVSLSPSSLAFGSQVVGTTSTPPLSVTLTNNGTGPLTFTALTPSGDFALDPSTTCSASTPVAVSGTCTIAVTFAPTATGARSGVVTISDDASGGTQVVALSGTGTAPGVSLSPSNLTFGSQVVGTTSAAQSVTLTNTGTSNLTITALTPSGDFALPLPSTSGPTACQLLIGTPLAAGGTCRITVIFTPTATGTRAGAVTITDNASSSPQTIILSGTGGAPAVTVSLTLVFPNQNVNETSAAEPVVLTNSGTTPLTVSGVTLTGTNAGDFAQTNTCVGTIAAGANCTVSVTFTPTTTGLRTATLTITDNAPGSPHTVAISGTGVVPAATPSTTAIDFPGNPLNLTCPVKTVTLANTGTGQLNISNIAVSSSNTAVGSFSVTAASTTCASTLAPGTSCVIGVNFTPAVAGTVSGALTIASDAPTSPTVIALTGTGTPACALNTSAAAQTVVRGTNSVNFTISDQKPSCTPDPIQLTCTVDNPATCALAQTTIQPTGSTALTVGNLQAVGAAPVHVEVVKTSDFRVAAVDMTVYVSDFAISEYPAAATVSAGQTASYSMTLSPVNGLKGNIQLSCQGAPEGASCSISPKAATLDGTSPLQATVTVSTMARSLGAPRVPPAFPPSPSTDGRWMWLLGLALLVSLMVASRRRRPALVLAGLLLTALVWAACGGGGMTSNSNPGTPAGTYTLTVTSTYSTSGGGTGELSHVTTLKLTVN